MRRGGALASTRPHNHGQVVGRIQNGLDLTAVRVWEAGLGWACGAGDMLPLALGGEVAKVEVSSESPAEEDRDRHPMFHRLPASPP